MKIVSWLTILLLIFSLNAYASQRLYDASSYEYRSVKLLAQSAGVVGPSSAVPVNGEELLIALNRIDRNALPSYLKERYDSIYSSLIEHYDGFSAEIPIAFSPQFFIANDKEQDRKEFFLLLGDEKPLIDIGLRLFFSDMLFMETSLPIMNTASNSHIPVSSFDFIFDKDLPIFQHMPIVARTSAGNNLVSFYLGRTHHGMGNGYTGNMIVSDNYRYQEVFNLKFTSNVFTYNIAVTHFDNQVINEIPTPYESFSSSLFESSHVGGKQQTRVVHRFDLNIANKIRAVLNLGTLYYASSSFDMRWFIPFMVFHSYYNYSEDEIISGNDEANNILSIEIDYPVAPKYNISLQIAMDQLQLPSESDKVPDAFGFLLSFSYVNLGRENDFEFFLEAAYTMPFLYIAPKKNDDDTYNWNYDYYLGYASAEEHLGSSREGAWSGFPYGPNSAMVAIGLNYGNLPARLNSSTLLMYIASGDLSQSISSFYDKGTYSKALLGDITHTIKLREMIDIYFLDSLEFIVGTEIKYMKNQDRNNLSLQLYLGLSWYIG